VHPKRISSMNNTDCLVRDVYKAIVLMVFVTDLFQ